MSSDDDEDRRSPLMSRKILSVTIAVAVVLTFVLAANEGILPPRVVSMLLLQVPKIIDRLVCNTRRLDDGTAITSLFCIVELEEVGSSLFFFCCKEKAWSLSGRLSVGLFTT